MTSDQQKSDKQLVSLSYGNCCLSPQFFDDFYRTFVASSPVIREKFANTNMAKQKELLREGITYMIMYFDGAAIATMKVQQLGQSHSQQRMDIAPALYDYWISALLQTVAKHDPQYNAELDQAWRRVLGKGIAMMRSMYAAPTPQLARV